VKYRTERDTLGTVKVPAERYFGAQTWRAVRNFPVSGLTLQPRFVWAQAVIKRAAATANVAAGRLSPKIGRALVRAADEVLAGKHAREFVVDVFQAGAGTSQNMNLNEVLANRACEILGAARGEYSVVHPNDHANMAQSTNDTIHSAIHIAAFAEIHGKLLPAAERLEGALGRKAKEFAKIVKSGRTHMQDAVPVTLGQEFGAYAQMVKLGRRRVETAADGLRELCIGGTAVGTGLNTDPAYRERVLREVGRITGYEFRAAEDSFEAMQSLDAVVEVSGALRVLVTSLRKVSADFILLSSGPRTGLGELRLPAVQPGSSIMPGKVNPVLAEMLSMICFHALGCDTAVLHASQAGQLDLNVMMPVVAYNLLQMIEILARGMELFAEKCVEGVEANAELCRAYAERSPALATALSPVVGYADAARIAKEALEGDALVKDLAEKQGLLGRRDLERLLDPVRMTVPPWSRKKEEGGPDGASERTEAARGARGRKSVARRTGGRSAAGSKRGSSRKGRGRK